MSATANTSPDLAAAAFADRCAQRVRLLLARPDGPDRPAQVRDVLRAMERDLTALLAGTEVAESLWPDGVPAWAAASAAANGQPPPAAWPPIPQSSLDATEAFRRDFPELLRDHDGEWVAYAGSRRVAVDPDLDVVYQQCQRMGFQREDLLFFGIGPGTLGELDCDITIS